MFAWLFAYWWLLLIESLIIAGVVGILALGANRLVGSAPTSLTALKGSMLLTALATVVAYFALIIGISKYMGVVGDQLVIMATFLSIGLVFVQWLISPWLINLMYRTRDPISYNEKILERIVARTAEKSGVGTVKVKIADIRMPNAFAYSSPLAGKYVAFTRGLLDILDDDEIEAVAAHEIGHLKHRDVSWILALSIIPLVVYFMGRMLIFTGLLGGGRRREESNPLILAALGAALLALSIVFKFLIAHFNRLREYYADAHSALVTGRPHSLQKALAKIYITIKRNPTDAAKSSFAAPLFIIAPLIDVSGGMLASIDEIIEILKQEEENPIVELFSTHPPISKRLRFLDNLALNLKRGVTWD